MTHAQAGFVVLHGLDEETGKHVAVLVQRAQRKDHPGVFYGAVGGFADPGEPPEQAALRELGEELPDITDFSGLELKPLPTYEGRRSDVTVHPFSAELTSVQLRALRHAASRLQPGNANYDPAYASAFEQATDGEITAFRVLPFEELLQLPFYEPRAAQDYRAVMEALSRPAPLRVSHEDVTPYFTPNVTPDPESLWLLVTIPPIAQPQAFSPQPALDGTGNPVGVIAVEKDGEQPMAVFRNPKDSLDGRHSTQKVAVDGTGVLIFPLKKDRAFGEELQRLTRPLMEHPSMEALDALLKNVHAAYLAHRKVPDMYNSDLSQCAKMDLRAGSAEAGMYSKKKVTLAILRIRAKDAQADIAFTGTGAFIRGGVQFGKGQIVLVHDAERGEIRKMAPDYAEENYLFLDGSRVTLDRLPTLSIGAEGLKPGDAEPHSQLADSASVQSAETAKKLGS